MPMRFLETIVVVFGLSLATVSAQTASGRPRLMGVEVTRPNIVVHGAFLSRVEVWAVPTGTGITPSQYVLLGKAVRSNEVGPKETWLFRIPSCASDTRLQATEIFVQGFDGFGVNIGKKSLPFEGASAVHQALCGAP
jgi:hypothetical protein